MKPTLVFDPEATSEFDEAYDFYQNRRFGLGDEFAAAIRAVILGILAQPKRHTVVLRETRRDPASAGDPLSVRRLLPDRKFDNPHRLRLPHQPRP